ncbi:leucine rich repeats family protein [Acinetobacter baumannii 146457]|nr:leucine rich repeats family protein [Acinetobacter baumannii 146457]
MITTKILGDAIGIQSQGTIDKTETQTNAGLTNAVIVGQFMRGRFDQPMVIHQGNIRGQLGHDPLNPYYNAVQDCLDTGVPSVQVLRVGEINKSIPISCTDALNVTDWIDISGDWKLEVDGELVRPDATSIDDVIAYLIEAGFEVTVESPVIGCEGATPTAFITTLRKIGSTVQEQSDALLGSIYNINGQDYSLEDSGPILSGLITGESLPSEELPPPEIIPAGYYYHYGNESSEDVSVYTAISKITNVSDSNLRLEMKAGNVNLLNVIWNNPTALKNQVCMSPAPIVEPPWDIEYTVNGQTYRELTGNPIPANYAKNRQREQADNGVSIFDWITGMTSLKINTTITDIGDSAFFECMQVADLQLPSTLKTVGNSAFYSLKKLKNLEMPNSVTAIGTHAFYGLEEATSIALSNSLTRVPQFAFDRAFKAQPTLVIPDSVTVIEEYAFREWKLTTKIFIGSGIQEIKENAFYGVGDYSNTLSQITVKAMAPPIIAPGSIPANECPIYVPAAAVNAYKAAAGWADFAPRIQAII